MQVLNDYLGNLDAMLSTAGEGSDAYVQPALKSLGSVSIVVLREVISPASFRNADAEITDIEIDGVRHVRAVANKFKYGERARGLQVLRFFGAGGSLAQNKTIFRKGEKPGDHYDLNTVVFGDSANTADNKVLPVKAGAQYSDAISLQDYGASVDQTFHNRAHEDGGLFDPEKKAPSVNIFERHFVRPGTLLLQVISFNGRTAPPEAFEHLLLSMGLAGAYGGQTSIYGINVRNRLVGAYAGRFERELASPYALVAHLRAAGTKLSDADAVEAALAEACAAAWKVAVPGAELLARQKEMIAALEAGDGALRARYQATAKTVSAFFNGWFAGV